MSPTLLTGRAIGAAASGSGGRYSDPDATRVRADPQATIVGFVSSYRPDIWTDRRQVGVYKYVLEMLDKWTYYAAADSSDYDIYECYLIKFHDF